MRCHSSELLFKSRGGSFCVSKYWVLEEAGSTKSWVSLRRALCRSEVCLTDSCGSSARALWRPGRGVGVGTPERKGVRVYVLLMHFAVPQKLPQRCEADTLQKPNETFLLETGNGLGDKVPVGVRFTPTERPVLSSASPPVLALLLYTWHIRAQLPLCRHWGIVTLLQKMSF